MFPLVPVPNHCYHWGPTIAYLRKEKLKNRIVFFFKSFILCVMNAIFSTKHTYRSANAAVLGQMRASILLSSTCSVHKHASPPRTYAPKMIPQNDINENIHGTYVAVSQFEKFICATCFIFIGSKCIRSHGRCL